MYRDVFGAFTNYVDKILAFLTPSVDIFYLMKVDKNSTLVDYTPFKMFGPFGSVWCKTALAKVGMSLP